MDINNLKNSLKSLANKKIFFKKVHKDHYGYNIKQVNNFLKKTKKSYRYYYNLKNNLIKKCNYEYKYITSQCIRSISFKIEKGGYDPVIVDKALDRMENFFAISEKNQTIKKYGLKKWLLKIEKLSFLIHNRLIREKNQKFNKPKLWNYGYDTIEVDAFCEYILEYTFKRDISNLEKVRYVTFSFTKRQNAYNENQVDMFIDKVIELMLAIQE